MLGSIIGDIIGSIYEVKEVEAIKNNVDKKRSYESRIEILDENVSLFTRDSSYTDDSVLTCAIADAIINNKDYEDCLRYYGLRELNLGMDKYGRSRFGKGFVNWLQGKGEGVSYGNGSAMRIASIGFLFDDIKTIKEEVYKATIPSHNNIDAIKGAEAVAVTIYLARNGESKEEIKNYIEKKYYKMDFNLSDLQRNYRFSSKCSESVPQALFCFLESNSFTDAIRKSISIGGDSDTIACIVGGISEAYYGIPEHLKKEVNNYIPFYMANVVKQFYLKRLFLDFMKDEYLFSKPFKEYLKDNMKTLDYVMDKNKCGCFPERDNDKLIGFKLVVPKLHNKKALLINIREYYKAMELYYELYNNLRNSKNNTKRLEKNEKGD